MFKIDLLFLSQSVGDSRIKKVLKEIHNLCEEEVADSGLMSRRRRRRETA